MAFASPCASEAMRSVAWRAPIVDRGQPPTRKAADTRVSRQLRPPLRDPALQNRLRNLRRCVGVAASLRCVDFMSSSPTVLIAEAGVLLSTVVLTVLSSLDCGARSTR